jgi:hypothetical protein
VGSLYVVEASARLACWVLAAIFVERGDCGCCGSRVCAGGLLRRSGEVMPEEVLYGVGDEGLEFSEHCD